MNVADKTPAGCELQPPPHDDVGPLYQLQWANSGLKPAITLLTILESSCNRKAAFIQNAVYVLTTGNCSWTVL